MHTLHKRGSKAGVGVKQLRSVSTKSFFGKPNKNTMKQGMLKNSMEIRKNVVCLFCTCFCYMRYLKDTRSCIPFLKFHLYQKHQGTFRWKGLADDITVAWGMPNKGAPFLFPARAGAKGGSSPCLKAALGFQTPAGYLSRQRPNHTRRSAPCS